MTDLERINSAYGIKYKTVLEAVRRNGWVLEYVKEQTPEICLEAVRRNGYALAYVKLRSI